MKTLIIVLLSFLFTNSLFPQDGRWGITAYGGIAIPSGDFATIYDNGFTVHGGMIYDLKFSTRIAVVLGYTRWALNEQAFNELLQESGSEAIYTGTAPLRTIPLLLQIKWYANQETAKIYGLIEGGLYFTKFEFSGNVTIPDSSSQNVSGSESAINTGIVLGLGVTIDLAENLEFYIAGRYNIVSLASNYGLIPVNYGNIVTTDQFWSVTAGINIILLE